MSIIELIKKHDFTTEMQNMSDEEQDALFRQLMDAQIVDIDKYCKDDDDWKAYITAAINMRHTQIANLVRDDINHQTDNLSGLVNFAIKLGFLIVALNIAILIIVLN